MQQAELILQLAGRRRELCFCLSVCLSVFQVAASNLTERAAQIDFAFCLKQNKITTTTTTQLQHNPNDLIQRSAGHLRLVSVGRAEPSQADEERPLCAPNEQFKDEQQQQWPVAFP